MNNAEQAVRSAFESVRFDSELEEILERSHTVHRRKRDFRLASVAASLLVVLVVALFVRSPEASAYWAAVPSTPDSDLVNSASELCESQLQADLPPLILIDQRADAARAVFGVKTDASTSMYACTLIRSGDTWEAPPVEDLPFLVHTINGTVPHATAKVVIDQTDGTRVEAAMSDGFFHFWWVSPESFPGGTMRFLDANGEVLNSEEVPAS